jgi:hypothetical protein
MGSGKVPTAGIASLMAGAFFRLQRQQSDSIDPRRHGCVADRGIVHREKTPCDGMWLH